jgi:hypothetical protein
MPDALGKAELQHRMALIMLGLLAINFVCIVHPYQLDSNVNFGLVAALCYGGSATTKRRTNRKSIDYGIKTNKMYLIRKIKTAASWMVRKPEVYYGWPPAGTVF